ncbi:MAG: ROK family protein [Phycisphaerales bacterium]|jgi:glucokinase|nr:ROK family protein [Phycisphaerales bacterium]
MTTNRLVGIDLGATNTLVGVVEGDAVTERHHRATPSHLGFEGVVAATCEMVSEVAPDAGAVGIAVAGSVDVESGVVLRAQNLDWTNAPLASAMWDRLGKPVIIENDVTAAAWGEHRLGAGKEHPSLFAAWVGTGIGGGLVLDGRPWRGPLGTAGEIGMSVSEPEGESGRRVVEDFASRCGLRRVLGEPCGTEEIAAAFDRGDEQVMLGMRRLGTALANVVSLLAVDLIVLGGGIVEATGEPLLRVIREQFDRDVFPPDSRRCRLALTELGPNAGILGAADLAAPLTM